MFLHGKELIQPVKVDKPDPKFGQYLLEQFGGATGELTAALQDFVQSFQVDHPGIKDMLQDIAVGRGTSGTSRAKGVGCANPADGKRGCSIIDAVRFIRGTREISWRAVR
jgi:hypothetical protein